MPASKNSANSPVSKLAALTFLALLAYGTVAAWSMWSRGYSFFYGDSEAHLNIARRILDSRTPNGEQIGTVWLPLPHLLIAPLAQIDALWTSGLAGVIPSVLCFALAGTLLYTLAARVFRSHHAGVAAALLFATNPSMLYLQSTAMTEPVMAAAVPALLLATLWYRDTQSTWALLVAAAVSNMACLIRYEGWFLIPFLTLFVWITARNKTHAYLFALLASAAPLSWLAHNLYYYGDALAFFRGPYSANAILQRQIDNGMQFPAAGNWLLSVRYYAAAARHVLGWPLLLVAGAGFLVALYRRIWRPLILMALPGCFYVWSMYASATPVFVPELEPFTRYNTRYALALLPLAAFAGAALIAILPDRLRTASAWVLAVLVALGQFKLPVSICWEEARIASEVRREWTAEAAGFLRQNYEPGSGVIFWFGDLAAVFRQAGIPYRETLYQDNGAAWESAMADPAVFRREEWVVAQLGDPLDQAVQKQGSAYSVARRIEVKGAPAVLIYRRTNP